MLDNVTPENTFEVSEENYVKVVSYLLNKNGSAAKTTFDETTFVLVMVKDPQDEEVVVYQLLEKETGENKFYASLTAIALAEDFVDV